MSEEKKSEEVKPEEVAETSAETPVEETPPPVEEATVETTEPAEPTEEEKRIAEEQEAARLKAEEEALAAEQVATEELRPGLTIRVHQKIKEGEKERVQVFQGIIIALRGKTPETKTMTVQKQSFGVMVEKIFPLASPLIEKIEVVKKAKVRRSKLYFLRDYSKRLKETLVKQ